MRHHVLLIGIDKYPTKPLFGCVNDVDAIQRVLIDRVGVARDRITRLTAPHDRARRATDVPSQLPTLANLRAAFARLGSDEVARGDVVFIYYSGHGTQTKVDDGRGGLFMREALIPVDEAEHGLLFDWELNQLVAAIRARTFPVTVVVDACCAAGALRGDRARPREARDRFKISDRADPQVQLAALPLASQPRGVVKALGNVRTCQVIAACRDDERAHESLGADGRVHGELTRALLRQLDGIHEGELLTLRWFRIWREITADVRASNPHQKPWFFGSLAYRVFGPDAQIRSVRADDIDAFIFGENSDDPGYAVVEVPGGYQFDVGTLNGITDGARIGIYGASPPAFPRLDSPEDRAARLFTVTVTSADRSSSTAITSSPGPLPPGARGRLVAPGQAARLRVGLLPDDPTLAAHLASDLIELVPADDADLVLERRADGWELTDDVFGDDQIPDRQILAMIPHTRLGRARALVEHYHAYGAPLRLADACHDLPCMLQISILACAPRRIAAELAQNPGLPELDVGADGVYEIGHGDRLCFVVHNASPLDLSISLIDCGSSGKVFVLGERRLPAQTQHVFWANETLGEPFEARCPDRRSVGIDRLVVIGTTRTDRSLAHLALRSSFADVLDGVTRGEFASRARGIEPEIEQWTSTVTTVRTRRR